MDLIVLLGYLRDAYHCITGQESEELKNSLLMTIKIASKELSESIREE